jgi:hypothetical protein
MCSPYSPSTLEFSPRSTQIVIVHRAPMAAILLILPLFHEVGRGTITKSADSSPALLVIQQEDVTDEAPQVASGQQVVATNRRSHQELATPNCLLHQSKHRAITAPSHSEGGLRLRQVIHCQVEILLHQFGVGRD